MKKLLILLLLFGCSQSKYLISWEHPRNDLKYDLYVVEYDSIGADKYVTKQFIDVEGKYQIYETKKNNKLVQIGIVAKGSTEESTMYLSEFFTK